jgi:2-dehydropantoate 2-reductase
MAVILDSALAPTQWDNHLSQALWNKLAINCCINPLTAKLNSKNGELDTPLHLATIETLSQEIAQVMLAEGLEAKAKVIFERVKEVIKATSDNYSSMQQDVFHQRRTEIDYISGYLIRCAKLHGLAVPTNEHLYHQIKAIENL